MKRVVLTGFMIWLLASVALRFWGQYLFNPGSTTVPDGGATVMLLGTALAGLGLTRRFLKV